MKTTQVTANAHQLTRFGLVNCYLVRESDGFTLIDANLSNSHDDILGAAKTLGAPIRRILLTHAHVDHVGSVDALLAKLGPTQVEFTSNVRSLPLLQKPPDKSLQPGESNEEIRGGLPGIDARPTRLLIEGELYGSLLVIETPGHIPGHLSFLDQRDGTLYAGDARKPRPRHCQRLSTMVLPQRRHMEQNYRGSLRQQTSNLPHNALRLRPRSRECRRNTSPTSSHSPNH